MGGGGYISRWLLQSHVWHLGDPFRGWGVPHRACRILVPRLRIESPLLTVKAWSPKHWTIRKSFLGAPWPLFSPLKSLLGHLPVAWAPHSTVISGQVRFLHGYTWTSVGTTYCQFLPHHNGQSTHSAFKGEDTQAPPLSRGMLRESPNVFSAPSVCFKAATRYQAVALVDWGPIWNS